MMTFGQKVVHLRDFHGWTHAEIVVRGGLSEDQRSMVANWVKAKGKVSPQSIEVLSTSFMVPPPYWSSGEPREYLGEWLRWSANAGKEDELKKLPPVDRLNVVLTELDRVWPGHNLLGGIRLTPPADLSSFRAGETQLAETQLEEIALALGLDASFLDTNPLSIDAVKRHQYDRIIAFAEKSGFNPHDLLMLISNAGMVRMAGHSLKDILDILADMALGTENK